MGYYRNIYPACIESSGKHLPGALKRRARTATQQRLRRHPLGRQHQRQSLRLCQREDAAGETVEDVVAVGRETAAAAAAREAEEAVEGATQST